MSPRLRKLHGNILGQLVHLLNAASLLLAEQWKIVIAISAVI